MLVLAPFNSSSVQELSPGRLYLRMIQIILAFKLLLCNLMYQLNFLTLSFLEVLIPHCGSLFCIFFTLFQKE